MLISSISVQPSLIQVRSRCSIQVLVLHVQMIGFRWQGDGGHGNVGGGQQTVWWQRWCSEAVWGALLPAARYLGPAPQSVLGARAPLRSAERGGRRERRMKT